MSSLIARMSVLALSLKQASVASLVGHTGGWVSGEIEEVWLREPDAPPGPEFG